MSVAELQPPVAAGRRRPRGRRRGSRRERAERRAGADGSGSPVVVLVVVVAAAALRPLLERLLDDPAVAHWATIFVAIAVQAMPFLVLGVAVSARRSRRSCPPALLPRMLPDRPRSRCRSPRSPAPRCPAASAARSRSPDGWSTAASPPAAALDVPACRRPRSTRSCWSRRRWRFPASPRWCVARLVASLLAATSVGLVWARFGRDDLLAPRTPRARPRGAAARASSCATAQHDLLAAPAAS